MRKNKDENQVSQQLLGNKMNQDEHENVKNQKNKINTNNKYASKLYKDNINIDDDIVITPTWADDNLKPRLRDTLCQWRFWTLIIYCFILIFGLVFAAIPMPIYGAQYFNGDNENASSCDSKANSEYALYYGIASSIGGVLGFFVQGQIGKLTDLYGRKKMMLFSHIVGIAAFGGTLTVVAQDLSYFYFVLVAIPLVTCVNGAYGGLPTALQASIADVLPPDHRTVGYGVVFGFAGLASILGAISAGITESIYGLEYSVYGFDILSTFGALWLMFLVPETLDISKQVANRKYYHKETMIARQYDKKTYTKHTKTTTTATTSSSGGSTFVTSTTTSNNRSRRKSIAGIVYYLKRLGEPLWPLLKMKDEPVLFGVGLITLFVSLPENGINDISTSYFYDVLQLCTTQEATKYSSVNAVLSGLTTMISQIILLPLMFGVCKISDLGGLFIGLTTILIMCLIGVMVYFIPQIWVGFLFSIFSSLTNLNVPILSGTLSKRLDEKEQGIGLGVLHAVKGITYATAPIGFALLYDNFADDKYGALKTISFLVGTGFILCGYPVLFCPLRNALNSYDAQKLEQSIKEQFQENTDQQTDKRYSRLSQLYPESIIDTQYD